MLGVIGRKCGMTRLFSKNGDSMPITVLYIEQNRVTQVKNFKNNGYCAIQVTTGIKKRSHINKSEIGHYMRATVEPGIGLWEFRLYNNIDKFYTNQILDINIFQFIRKVDVTAFSKGKGFQGVVKRHNFKTQDATHGNSLSHRAHGSTGQNQTPGRVFKNKKMAGHMGCIKTTIQNLDVIKIDSINALLLVKGNVPGPKDSNVIIRFAIKKQNYNIDKFFENWSAK